MFEPRKLVLPALLLAIGASCQRDGKPKDFGAVEFALAIPGGARVDRVDLHLVCAGSGVDLRHTLDVRRGEVVATFGGLTPGGCVVTMQAVTDTGAMCAGNQAFTVVARELVKVVVPLFCQGVNDGPAGRVTVGATFTNRECGEDRIKVVYAIPGNVNLGESTQVEVQLHESAVAGQPTFVWAIRNEVDDTGEARLSMPEVGACREGSATCMRLHCTGLGAAPEPDPDTGKPRAGLFVSVTYEDDECFDTEEVWVYCVQSSVCGDGVIEGQEECEDGNAVDDDGCSAQCRTERCGDGVLQRNEECDGMLGVSSGQMCSADCRRIEARCGDGVVNHAAEECDGTAGLQANQVCGQDCRVVPVCGNGVLERGEDCDRPSDPDCVNCRVVGGGAGGAGGVSGAGGMSMTGSGGATGSGGTQGSGGAAGATMTGGTGTGGTGGMTGTGGVAGAGGTVGTGGAAGAGGMTGTGGAAGAGGTASGGIASACRACIGTIPEVGEYTADVCEPDPQCSNALTCLLRTRCWVSGVPAQCYCGPTQADLDNCETPTFTPKGPCARELLSGAGSGATNADVLNRYFDPQYPSGRATIIVDSAFLECRDQCF